MPLVINADFSEELAEHGGYVPAACFNCGTCTAICPLVHEHFPRRMIRYAQLGATQRIMDNAGELWMCLHCGQCTQTCPRNASPGELMAALRRFVVARWRRQAA